MPSSAPPTLHAEMRQGFRWSFGTTLLQGILQVGVTMTMARLLEPAHYGLYAMVEVVIRWASVFGQTGLATALAQRAVISDEEWRAARTVALAYATGAFAVVLAGAPLIAAAFGDPAIVPLLRVASLSFLINAVGLVSFAALRRRLQFGRIGAAEIAGYVLGNAVTAITLARAGAGVWSVVVGSLVGQLVQNLVAVTQNRPAKGFRFRAKTLRPLVQDSAHVSLNSVMDVTNNTMDTFVVARVLPGTILGAFNRATMLATLPANFLWASVGKVTLPGYARLQAEPRRFARFFTDTKQWTGTLTVAVMVGMIPAAEPVVGFLLGEKWLAVVPILRPLLLGFAFESLAVPYHSALDALGHYSARSLIRIPTLLVRASLLAAIVTWRFPGIFYVSATIGAFTWVLSVLPLARRLAIPAEEFFIADLKIIARAAVCGLAVLLVHTLVRPFGWPAGLTLLACMLAGGFSLAAFFHTQLRALALP